MKDGITKELTNDGYDDGIMRGKEPNVSLSLSKGWEHGGMQNANKWNDRVRTKTFVMTLL